MGLSSLSGLGSLASGFQQGVGFAEDVQLSRRRKKALDYTLNQMGREDAAAQANSEDVSDEERAFYGDDTSGAFMPEFGTDPFLYRMMDLMARRRGKKRQAQQALPQQPMPEEGYGFRDGGSVEPKEKILERAKQNRARSPASVESTTQSVKGAGAAESTAARSGALNAVKSTASRLGSAVRGAAGAGAAFAGIAGALRGFNTPTEDYAVRMGIDPSQVGMSFWKDLGIRTPGVLSDVGAAAGDLVGVDLRSNFADEQMRRQKAEAAAQPAAAAAPAPRQQALATEPVIQAAAQARQPAAGRPAAPAAPAKPQLGDALDMSNVDIDASEIPDIKTDDWKRYRAQALRTARLRGLPQAQALEEADRMVTTMQVRGFSNYASQAQALLQAGNTKGALRSLRAAYQYFPDGNDVKLGVHNGKIVAVGVDEATGEPFEGGTRVITPEFLAGAIQNFQNPQNFLAWTKDWRDEAAKRQKYEEVEKPLAQAQGQALRTNAEANVARSEAAALRAQLTSRGGGLKPADMARSEAVYRERLGLLGVTDEAQADQLAAVMSKIKQANPQVPDNMVVDFVMKAQGRPDGAQFIQRALSGQ